LNLKWLEGLHKAQTTTAGQPPRDVTGTNQR
jgi:hypothetical protein